MYLSICYVMVKYKHEQAEKNELEIEFGYAK